MYFLKKHIKLKERGLQGTQSMWASGGEASSQQQENPANPTLSKQWTGSFTWQPTVLLSQGSKICWDTCESHLKIYENKREMFLRRPETPQQYIGARLREIAFIIAQNIPRYNLGTQKAPRKKVFFWGWLKCLPEIRGKKKKYNQMWVVGINMVTLNVNGFFLRELGLEGGTDPHMLSSQLLYLREFSHFQCLVIMRNISSVLRKCEIMLFT